MSPKLGKPARVAERRRIRNKPIRSRAKTEISTTERLIAANDTESAISAYKNAQSILDKAVQKGVLHRNNAARRKSRLMKKLNTALSRKDSASQG